MRTFQFSDSKSHKFWNIDVSGSSFTVTYGKIGTAGQTSSKSFATPEKAQAEAEKLVREKTGKGYVETTVGMTVSDEEAFERSIQESPNDIAKWSAYADYLMEKGDPRGEFMQVQIALEDESKTPAQRKQLAAREKELLKEHERTWLGPLAEAIFEGVPNTHYVNGETKERPPIAHRFSRGWLERLEFHSLKVAEARAFAKSPGARLTREVVIESLAHEAPVGRTEQYIDSYYEPGPDVPEDCDSYSGPSLHALCRCAHLKSVRSFRLGENVIGPDGQEEEYMNCHMSGEVAHHLVKQMPNIEELFLFAHRVDAGKIFPLPMPNLRTLMLYHSHSYPLERLGENATITKLSRLQCHPHAMEYDDEESGAYIRLRQLRGVCQSAFAKTLTHLTLRLTDFGDDGAKVIVESGILKNLRVLDLQGGCITDAGAATLAGCPDLKNLELLNLRSNAMTSAGEQLLVRTGVKVNATQQHSSVPPFEEGDYPEYLGEGDIE